MEKITYKSIIDAYRASGSEVIQKLPDNFYQLCSEWIKRKGNNFQEIEKVRRILQHIYDRREKKILELALSAIRSNVVPTNLLSFEKDLFEDLVKTLLEKREKFQRVLSGENKRKNEVIKPEKKSLEKEEKKFELRSKRKIVRISSEIQEFIGPELMHYGPFKQGDLVTLPIKIAELLIKKKKAEFC